MNEIEGLCGELLDTWCESLLFLQSSDGSIRCPACEIDHGRCFDAMYPFFRLYDSSGDRRWYDGAMRLFFWAEGHVSQEDGSYKNDITSAWTGTTVFSLIQLLDSLMAFGSGFADSDRKLLVDRARRAAEYLYAYDDLRNRNINYPIANSLALYLAYQYFGDARYREKSDEYVSVWKSCFTPHGLLYGEGNPREARTAKGNAPIDIGYNLEESLPSIIRLGMLSGNEELVRLGESALVAHLPFILSDGGMDNSFGSRSFKWTYYGSRTSDGMIGACLLLRERSPLFSWIALQNLRLQKTCTLAGLLAGGPGYGAAGQVPCVHHSFTHAKVLAYILQERLYGDGTIQEIELPRYQMNGIRYYPELATAVSSFGGYTATITANDWIYLPEGHPSGGSISLFHHVDAGPILVASMNDYVRKEKNNMQLPRNVKYHECLTPRIEMRASDQLYASIYDFSATIHDLGDVVTVSGSLTSRNGWKASPYMFVYRLDDDGITITVEYQEGIFIIPLIMMPGDVVETAPGTVVIMRNEFLIRITLGRHVLPYHQHRIFHLVPGFQALRIDCMPESGKSTVCINVERL